jgi:hypothetical protein
MNPLIHQQIIIKIRKLPTHYQRDPQTKNLMVHLCQTSAGTQPCPTQTWSINNFEDGRVSDQESDKSPLICETVL